ncbi:MAG TPA: hypothetical protein VHL31_20485 [Geminicoccus sp.]|jgi:hypothetical protein|uniref:hypothetical protein n=1 Tax=Geminicoccus sp. TaxID=2024832 RepID=UPI002E2EB34C|nr:hypothetical protein [Geminicoccus sp.]HEX2528659.1 hypothetical protein [Geminicoccus sp.]
MLRRGARQILMIAALALAAGTLAACTESIQDRADEGSGMNDWGPQAGPSGLGGEGPSARPGD